MCGTGDGELPDPGHARNLRQRRGAAAENAARAYLRGKGREILTTNYHCPYGEIDIIARDGGTICFVEVRSRAGRSMVSAAESVDRRKQEKLLQTARHWLASTQCELPCRFDIVEVEWSGASGRVVNLLEDCFGES